jgi:hypothetical protein
MKNSIRYLAICITILCSCCKPKPAAPKINTTNELSAEMMAYFVNYQVGTKWIYRDTMDSNNLDTIELMTKDPMDINSGNGTLSKGYMLYYKPKKSQDFKIFISAGNNNNYYVKVEPTESASGAIIFESENGIWKPGVTYYDSIEITGNKYYDVVHTQSSSTYHARFYISKNNGIIFFWRMNGNGVLAAYKLTNIIKP